MEMGAGSSLTRGVVFGWFVVWRGLEEGKPPGVFYLCASRTWINSR